MVKLSHILNIERIEVPSQHKRLVGRLDGVRSNHNQSWRMSRLIRSYNRPYAHSLWYLRSKSVSHKNNPLVISYFRFDSISIWYAFELQLIAHTHTGTRIPKYRHCGTSSSLKLWLFRWKHLIPYTSQHTHHTHTHTHSLPLIFFSAFTLSLALSADKPIARQSI